MAAAHSDWSELPHLLLVLVLHQLPYPDFIRSQAVCKSWLIGLKSMDMPIKTHSPMLLLAGDEVDGRSEFRTLFSLADKKKYRLYLPRIRGRRILASADGWLLTIDDAAELHLFNPFTYAEHALPSITTLSTVSRAKRDSITGRITGYTCRGMPGEQPFPCRDLKHMLRQFYRRGGIFYQSSSSEIVVFVFHGDFPDLAAARLGDESWTELPKTSSYDFFTDVILHKGHYTGVTNGGFCYAFDISRRPKVICVGPPNHGGTVGMYYLAESSDGDHLMLICRHRDCVFKTQKFTVFLLDKSKNKMINVERLEEGTTLFLGDNRSMLLHTRDLPELKDNCIYFTDNEIALFHTFNYERLDVGVFHMKYGNVENVYPSESILDQKWLPSVWLTPPNPKSL